MGSFSLAHWLIVIVVLLLVFGPKRLSEVGKGLGQGIRNFKKGVGGDGDDDAVESKPRRVKSRDDEPKALKSASKRAAADDDDDDDDLDEEEEQEEARPRRRKKARRG